MLLPSIVRWLRFEGSAVFGASIYLYALTDRSWWLFAGLLLAPDLAMVGYLRNPRLGARMYNIVHTYVGPLMLTVFGVFSGKPLMVSLGLIWAAHIGMDRMLGYGLKLESGFQHTHLGIIGRPGPQSHAFYEATDVKPDDR